MVGAGPGAPQDAREAAGVGEAAPHRLGEFGGPDIVGARGEERETRRARSAGRRAGRVCDSRATPPEPSRFERANAGGSAMTMSKRSPAAASAAASANTSPRRNRDASATPLRRGRLRCQARGRAPNCRCRATAAAPRCAAAHRKPAAVAIQIEHPRSGREPGDEARGCRAGRKTTRSSVPPSTSARNTAPPSSTVTGPSMVPSATAVSSGSPSSVRAGLSLRSTIAAGDSRLAQRLDDERRQPVHAGGVRLHDQDPAKPVDDEPRQAVCLGMDEPVIGRIVKPLAQPECALEPAREKALVDRPAASRSSRRAGDQRVRVEHRDPERPLVRSRAR